MVEFPLTTDYTQVEFPLEPSLAKMLIFSEEQKCVDDVATVVSSLSMPTIFYRPKVQLLSTNYNHPLTT